jgi:hypothetical protein
MQVRREQPRDLGCGGWNLGCGRQPEALRFMKIETTRKRLRLIATWAILLLFLGLVIAGVRDFLWSVRTEREPTRRLAFDRQIWLSTHPNRLDNPRFYMRESAMSLLSKGVSEDAVEHMLGKPDTVLDFGRPQPRYDSQGKNLSSKQKGSSYRYRLGRRAAGGSDVTYNLYVVFGVDGRVADRYIDIY